MNSFKHKSIFMHQHGQQTCVRGVTNCILFPNSVDEKGQVVRINFNNATRDTIFDIPAKNVKPFYAALKDYVDLLNSPDNKYTYKMKPGKWK